MKQVFVTILALVYLYTSIGATIYQHFCMGEPVSVSLFSSKDKACGKCGMEKHSSANNDCCKDLLLIIKGKDFHTSSQTVYHFHSVTIVLQALDFAFTSLNISPVQKETRYWVLSPPLIKELLFIQFRNIRI